MKLNLKTRYGLSTLAKIAREAKNTPITGKVLSISQKISEPYVEQIMLPLVSGGLVRTIRGSKGGYVLNKDTKSITLLDVIELYEGRIDFSGADEGEKATTQVVSCQSRKVWKVLEERVRERASEFTLEDILEKFMNSVKEGEYII